MFRLAYDLILATAFILYCPKYLYDRWLKKKKGAGIGEKLGLSYIPKSPLGKKVVWVHAVSLGETKAVSSLANQLKERDENCYLVISCGTATGLDEAKKSIPTADVYMYFPLDFSWVMNHIVQRIKPDVTIISETDLWYNFIESSFRLGSKIFLVNGKVSQKSVRFYSIFPFWGKRIFSHFHRLFVQDAIFKERFIKSGADPKKILVTGNMKLDTPPDEIMDAGEWKRSLGIKKEDFVLVIGSTHHPEECEILDQMLSVWKRFPKMKVLLIPRHPERFDEVEKLIISKNMLYSRYSAADSKDLPLVLIDQMGILKKCYHIADLAIVAGSFSSKVGGHNILEPCAVGVPVLFGPYMHQQPQLKNLALSHKAGITCSIEDLSTTLIHLIQDETLRKTMGDAGLGLMNENRGATEKTYNFIKNEVPT